MTVGPTLGMSETPLGGVLIRSEERLDVSTVRVPVRRVRLEKFVVTETRTFTVEVSREEVRLVEIDLDDDVMPPDAGPEAARWLVLSEEQVVVTTTVVPVQRVRLEVSQVVEERSVTDEVRRERVTLHH